mgnify:CR=1 FL=1
MTIKILDTFAGIGGFSYAAEKLVGGFDELNKLYHEDKLSVLVDFKS